MGYRPIVSVVQGRVRSSAIEVCFHVTWTKVDTETTWTTSAEESTKHTMLLGFLAEDTLGGKRPRTPNVSGGKARKEVRERGSGIEK